MTVEESLNNMDISINTALALKGQINDETVGMYHLEELEGFSPADIRKLIERKIDADKKHIFIFTGWIFTKEIYELMYAYYNYEVNDENSDFYVITFIEFPLFIVTDSKERYNIVLKSLKESQFKYSSLNIKNVVESDNGVQINYLTHTTVKLFEEKPKSMQKPNE